jgi:hypothetical protein
MPTFCTGCAACVSTITVLDEAGCGTEVVVIEPVEVEVVSTGFGNVSEKLLKSAINKLKNLYTNLYPIPLVEVGSGNA